MQLHFLGRTTVPFKEFWNSVN